MRRRDFLKVGAAAGALLLATPLRSSAQTLDRRSRLFPDDGTRLLTADLHNHTLLSDGAARAEDAFAMMRGAGIDVAALTDHAVMGKQGGQITCASGECTAIVGINEDSWHTLSALADASNENDAFSPCAASSGRPPRSATSMCGSPRPGPTGSRRTRSPALRARASSPASPRR